MADIKRVAILFAGGPAPAANAVISTAAVSFLRAGAEVIGIKHGYSSLADFDPAQPLEEGEPITLSDVQRPVSVPAGWWALTLEVPTRLAPGSQTRLVLAGGDGPVVPGIVVSSQEPDRFDTSGPTALIAVPAEDASRVAAAASARQVTVLIAP